LAEEDLADGFVMGVARLDLLRGGVGIAEAALEGGDRRAPWHQMHRWTDGQMHTCLHLEAQGWKPDKAALPDPARRAVLKRQKLILEWRLKESAKADVRQTIREEYDEVPEAYDRRIWEDEVERTFQLMFGRYSADAVAREIGLPPI
jgi:hypothetical protein